MKRLFALLLVFSLAVLPASALEDVAEGSWYAQAVDYVLEQGLMSPSGGRFRPNAAASRGMVVTVLWRLAGSPEAEATASFSDVSPDSWYAQAAAWGHAQGIVAGSGGAFRGDQPVTREQLAVFLLRYCRFAGLEVAQGPLSAYADAETVSAWAEEGMAHAVGAGLITGTSGFRLDPKGSTTRAQLAVILRRLTTPAVG